MQPTNLTGYINPLYADSLSYFGTPRFLPASGGWILERQIPGTPYRDGMGCYPLFTCQDWSKIPQDLKELEGDLVSLALVTDPFGDFCSNSLHEYFMDRAIPFKEHFVVDLNQPLSSHVSENHRRNAKKAFEKITVEVCKNPLDVLDDWVELYSALIKRHKIMGIARFSKIAFIKQFHVPGIIVMKALFSGTPVGMVIWYTYNDRGYYHLSAYNDLGYELKASFAVFWHSMEYFSEKLNWLDLGAGPGLTIDGKDGLSRFKRGWSTETKTVFFCGRILNPDKYEEIIKSKNIPDTNYFPSYRLGEFK
jgi:hypothetical protein